MNYLYVCHKLVDITCSKFADNRNSSKIYKNVILIQTYFILTSKWHFFTLEERITRVSFRTSANWHMIFNGTLSHLTASSRTGIYALETGASQLRCAVVANLALPAAASGAIRVTIISRRANTSTSSIMFATLSIWPTRGWCTWARGWCHFGG